MFRTLLFLLNYFKLGILGFLIVVTILYTIYSHRIYTPQDSSASLEQTYIEVSEEVLTFYC